MNSTKKFSILMSLVVMLIVIGIVPIVNRKKGAKLPEPFWMKKKVLQPEDHLANSINAFGIDLYKELIKTEQNLICSSYSLASLFTMLLLGSKGETASEIIKALHFEDTELTLEQVNIVFHTIINMQRNHSSEYVLNIASSIWVHKVFKVFVGFKAAVEKIFQSQEATIDFESGYAKDDINAWIAKVTNGQIHELFERLDPSTRLILANVMYFKGKWLHAFDDTKTMGYDFHNNILGNVTIWPVEMMYIEEHFVYFKSNELEAQIIQLPYAGDDIIMIIILPFQIDGLYALEDKITLDKIYRAIEMMKKSEVFLKIPRFKLMSSLRLKKSSVSLGMVKAFQKGQADLSGISSTSNLTVSEVIQKARIDVDETGTIAAAASEMELDFLARSLLDKVYFTVDHPFLFFILHKPTNVFLFTGRVLYLDRFERTLEPLPFNF